MDNVINNWMFLRELHQVCQFQTKEGKRVGLASSSELKRWLQQGAVWINGQRAVWDAPVEFPVVSLVLFPKHNKVTLW